MKRRDFLREIRGLSLDKLSGKITESEKNIVLLGQDKLLGKLKNPRQITALRSEIARMKTILDEKVAESAESK